MNRLLDYRALFFLGCLLVLAVYWPGLRGGFLLDDFDNLAQLERLARGDVTWLGPILSNPSGPLGRPLSMASFVASVAAGGHAPWSYKVGNLFLHLTIGALVGLLAARCVREDRRLAAHWQPIAVFVALWWLALPVHTSTVLYAVQRMSQVSALFLILGLLAYVAIRCRLRERPESRLLKVLLPTSVIVFTLFAALGKENGVLLPALCLVVEFTLFADASRGRRTAIVTMAVLVGAPVVLGILGFPWLYERYMTAYEIRPFTLLDRVLTQPRVLWDYVSTILVPSNHLLGVYQDDFPVSRSLSSPATTLPAILCWFAVVGAALRYRRSAPLAAAGALLFLTGHTLESSVLPLEIYFEHRNYFPSIGVLLAIVGLSPAAFAWIGRSTSGFRRLAPWLPVLLLGVLLAATLGRALIWASPEALLDQSAQNRPESPRIASILAARSVSRGEIEVALPRIDRLEQLSPMEHGSAALLRLVAFCVVQQPVPPDLVDAAGASAQAKPTNLAIKIAGVLVDQLDSTGCPGLDAGKALRLFERWVAVLTVPPGALGAWKMRYNAARMAARSGQWDLALALATQAYADSGWNGSVGVFSIQIANRMRNRDAARALTARFTNQTPAWDLQLQELGRQFQQQIDGLPESTSESDDQGR